MANKIWTPPQAPKRVVVKAEIITAKYHPTETTLIVAVRLPNGKARSCPDTPDNHLFEGKPAKLTPLDEVHRGMERMAEAYRQARGRPIKVEVDESELQ